MDKLKLLRGDGYKITNRVTIKNPTVGEICDFSEERYWHVISGFTATAYDYRVLLDDQGVDYVGIEDYEMFLMVAPSFSYEDTKLLLPDIKFEELYKINNTETGEIALGEAIRDKSGQIVDFKPVIDRYVYHEIADYIRNCHGYERNWLVPGNRMARKILIDDERERLKNEPKKPFKSLLEPLVSSLCNMEGFKYNYDTVWDLSIYAFLDALHRIEKIRISDHTYARLNSGFFDMKKANKAQLNKDLNWKGELF